MFAIRKLLGACAIAFAVAMAFNIGGSRDLVAQSSGLTGLPNGSTTNVTISGQTATKGIFFTATGPGFAGHRIAGAPSTGSPTPTYVCGDTPTAATGSNDNAGQITHGGTSTTCVITFGTAWGTAPACIIQDMTTGARAVVYSVSTTAITMSALTAADVIAWSCTGLGS